MAGHEILDLGAGVRIPAPQLLIFLLFPTFLSPPIIFDSSPRNIEKREILIEIKGNSALTDKEIRKILFEGKWGMRSAEFRVPNSEFRILEDGLERLRKAYRDQGYLLAEFEVTGGRKSPKENRPGYGILLIREGSRFFVGKIQVEGASLFTRREIISQMNTRKGEVFRDRVFEDDVEDLLQRYEDRGYPFCRIEPYGFRLNQTGSHGEEGRVDFGLHIEEGPLVRIEGFEVRGNQITREGVITREFRLKKGDLYSQKRIDRGRKELEALPFIKVRRIELLTPGKPNRGILQVEVEEGRMNRMEGFLGYKPPDGDEEELIGSVQITLENFLGTGRGIQGRWERLSSLTSSLQIEYKEPWLFRIPLHGSIDFLHTLQDTLYTESQVHLKLEIPLTPTLSGFLGVGGRRIIPDRLQTPRSTEYQGILGASLDTREERRNPRKGIFYSLETETGFKFNYPTATLPKVEKERSRVIKWRYEFHHWLPMGRSSNTRQVLYFSVQGGEVRTNEKEIPLYDLFKFGGATTLRGYQEQTFWGSRVVWANLEYRYILSNDGRLFVFLDGGYYEDEVETREFLLREKFPPRRFYPGYGVGLSLGSRLGLFGIAYGLGKGDSPLEGKIHFTLETEF